MTAYTSWPRVFPWSRSLLVLHLTNMIGFWAIGWYRVHSGGPPEAGVVWVLAGFGWLVHYRLLKRRPYAKILKDRMIIARGSTFRPRTVLWEDVRQVRAEYQSLVLEMSDGGSERVILPFIKKGRRSEARSLLVELCRREKA